MDAYEILVIILSISLFIFLVCSIIIAVLVITLVKSIQRLTDKAENAANNVNELALSLTKKAAPAVISGLMAAGMKHWREKEKQDKKGNKDD